MWAMPSGADPRLRTTSTLRCRPAAVVVATLLLGVSPSAAAPLQPVAAFHVASDPSKAAQGLRKSPEAVPGLTACPKRGSISQVISFKGVWTQMSVELQILV